MAKGGKKHFGGGLASKGDGSGGMSGGADVRENMVLSNRDKEQASKDRGRDGKWEQAEQEHNTELHQK
jgi:hypothetical protein